MAPCGPDGRRLFNRIFGGRGTRRVPQEEWTMASMRVVRGGRRVRRGWVDAEDAVPVFGIVIWPGAAAPAEAAPLAPVARVRLREVFAPAAGR